jgi:PTS system cellobiose-specific IIB component
MNILLCCGGGFSSSLLVEKMKKSAKEQGINATIWAVGETEVKEEIKKADILLVAPQIRFFMPKFKEFAIEKNVPVELIQPTHYGTCNGAEVLKFALNLLN